MPEISPVFALIAGFLAFFSACLIPIVPAYLAYISGVNLANQEKMSGLSGRQLKQIRRKIFLNSLYFVFGFSVIFIILGAAASFAGQFLIEKRIILQKLSGLFMVLVGLYIIGPLKLPWLYKEFKINIHPHFTKFQFINSFLIGAAFGFSWTPCVGPILASILFLSATSQTMWEGIYLLALFSLGLAIPFLIISLSLSYSFKILSKINRHLKKIQIFTGLLITIMGILLLAGKWEELLAYFIKSFN